jgi:hypothetical protein
MGSSENMRCIHYLDILTDGLLIGRGDGISGLIDPSSKRANGTKASNIRIQSYLHIEGWDLLTRNFV